MNIPKEKIQELLRQLQDCLNNEKTIPIPQSYADELVKAANEYNHIIRGI